MEKVIFKTKSKNFRIILSTCCIVGFVWDKPNLYVTVGPFIFDFTIKKKKIVPQTMKLLVGFLLLVFMMSSCAGNKYGCGHGHPKQSWKKLVNRINKP